MYGNWKMCLYEIHATWFQFASWNIFWNYFISTHDSDFQFGNQQQNDSKCNSASVRFLDARRLQPMSETEPFEVKSIRRRMRQSFFTFNKIPKVSCFSNLIFHKSCCKHNCQGNHSFFGFSPAEKASKNDLSKWQLAQLTFQTCRMVESFTSKSKDLGKPS